MRMGGGEREREYRCKWKQEERKEDKNVIGQTAGDKKKDRRKEDEEV